MGWVEPGCLRATRPGNRAPNRVGFCLMSGRVTLCVIHKTRAWLHNYPALTYVFYAFISINGRNKIIVEYTSRAAYIDHSIILTAALCLGRNLTMAETNPLLFCSRKT